MQGSTGARPTADRWRWGSVLVALGAMVLYWLPGVWPSGPSRETFRLGFGVAAALLLLLAALYGWRRRAPSTVSRLGLGSARSWLLAHTYGGGLFLLLLFLHGGVGLPSGVFNRWMWGLSLWTVASGIAGLALQRWIPRVLASGLSIEVLYERIPELVSELRLRAQRLVAGNEGPLRSLYARQLLPALEGPRRRFIYYVDITGGIQSHLREFRYLGRFLQPEEQETLAELEQLYRTKLEMDAHYTLQQILRIWPWFHVPTSILLVGVVILHVVLSLYY